MIKPDLIETEKQRLKDVVVSYDEQAPFDIAMRDYMMRTLSPYMHGQKCLQVGCSHGDQTTLLRQRFNDLTVVEGAQEFIDYTSERVGPSVRFVHSLVERFITDERYDVIVISHVLEHVIDAPAVLRHLRGLLASEGRLFVIVPNGSAASRQIAVKMGALTHLEALSIDDERAGHRRVYMLDTLRRDVLAAGMSIYRTGGIFFKPLANFQFNKLMNGPLISAEFMEGCYQLGFEHPHLCASIYVVAN